MTDTSAPPTVSVTVDGKTIEAAKGELVIEAAERTASTSRASATTRG